tara:strand:- start:43 stop:534 length:492 start_codon:yes stop_codon:yes gene_type:complete
MFNAEVNIISSDNSGNYEIELSIVPENHTEKSKIYNIDIHSNVEIENHLINFILDPNENIILSFGSNLENINYFNNPDFKLSPPYPNPFNPIVNFNVNNIETQEIDINIYDINGNKIDNIFNGTLTNGLYNFEWDASNFSTGIYFINCKNNNSTLVEKVYLIK